ncbi:hypothetical protein GQF03_12735 [Sneathiella chungangensis]|uniref:3-oxoadipate--succinyl-CoA transferase subunit B n=1 Tax=Sneathiella chungangensis TaxID=1418234 RepID=A0A845MHP3_9PROT|nr:CoA-transferase [Sneathiella chungangensis]MZR23195.1 hypothetical protein [Sneathiella chungangensis]
MSIESSPVAWPELAAYVLSKELGDGEIGSPGGARSEIPLAAARLAQLTHAPNLMIITSAAGFVANSVGKAPAPLFHSTMDYRNIYAGTETVLNFMSVFYTPRDWFFAGGLQVDSFGNLNMTAIGDIKAPKLKGPGGAGLSYASSVARRYFIYMQQHSKLSFVNKLDYVTAMGYGSGPGDREALGLVGGGPALVFSPMAAMDFCATTKRMRLRSVHPGHTVEEVLDNTGAEIIVPEEVPTTALPDAETLEILRSRVDPSGVLRNLKGARND